MEGDLQCISDCSVELSSLFLQEKNFVFVPNKGWSQSKTFENSSITLEMPEIKCALRMIALKIRNSFCCFETQQRDLLAGVSGLLQPLAQISRETICCDCHCMVI